MAREKFIAMGSPQLEEKLLELKSALGKERASLSSGTRAEKPAKIRNLRRDIARVLTAITAKKKGIVSAPKKSGAKPEEQIKEKPKQKTAEKPKAAAKEKHAAKKSSK